MSVLVDTDLVISGMKGVPEVLALLDRFAGEGLAVSTITLAEIFEGAFHTQRPDQHLLRAREFLGRYVILDVSDAIAEEFGAIRATLRRQGNLIADMDLLIAATALSHDLTLVTGNTRHFTRVPGLRLHRMPA